MKVLKGVVLGLLVAMTPALQAEEEDGADSTARSGAVATEDGAVAADGAGMSDGAVKAKAEKPFYTLPMCRLLEGAAQVLRPGKNEWEDLEEGKFYPFGCSYKTLTDSARLVVAFGAASSVEISGKDTCFGTLIQPVGKKDRTVVLKSGTIKVSLPRSLSSGLFKVSAPGFTVVDMTGEAECTYDGNTGDGDEANIKCVTGVMSIEGRHFRVNSMNAADEVKIRTSQDVLFTGIYGTSGDCMVTLDQGVVSVMDVETGTTKEESRKLEWRLSPQTAIRIHRAKPAIGEKMSVTVMTFDASGSIVNRCTFAEGIAALNTGEQGEGALAAKEESTKRAVADADAVTTEAAPEEATSADEEASATTTEKTDETTLESIIEE